MRSPEFSRRAVLRGVATGAGVGLTGCSGAIGGPEPEPLPDARPGPDDWPMAGYDARNSRYNPAAMPPRSTPEVRWSNAFPSCHEPVVRGTRVVLNAGDHTVGVRATDGEWVWASKAEPWGHPTPTLGVDRAYVTGPDCVFGVDLDTGAETWHGRPCRGANTASGTLADGRLYLEYGGYFSALDATGRVTWAAVSGVEAGSPAVAGDTAYVATVFAAEAIDLTAPATEPPLSDLDDDDPPYASADAAQKWSVPPEGRIDGPRVYRSPAVADDAVFVTVEREDRPGGELRALDRATGEERWTVASPPERGTGEPPVDAPEPVGRPAAPVVTGDLVVTALGDRRLRAVTRDGAVEWTARLEREVTDLAGGRGTLLAVTHDRSVESTAPGHAALSAFDLKSGERLWGRGFEDHVEGLAVAGGTVYATVVTDRLADGGVAVERLVAFG